MFFGYRSGDGVLQVTLHGSDEAAGTLGATQAAGELGIEEALGGDGRPLRRQPPAGTGTTRDSVAHGSAVVAVGDVAGHGAAAAAGMARIGNALSGLSMTGQPASTLLGWLNRLVCADEVPERVASAVVCVLDQARPALRWAQAGHLPPVLVSGGEARPLPRPFGVLLGSAPNAEYGLAYEQLAAGDVLFCYTDGLIERRGRDIDEGLAGLLAAAACCQRETADDAVIALFGRLEPPAGDDDVCVLAVGSASLRA